MRLHDDQGFLELSADMQPPLPARAASFGLLPASDDEAVTGGTGRWAGETVRHVVRDGVAQLELMGAVFVRADD